MTKLAYTPAEAAEECGVKVDIVKDAVRLRALPARESEGDPVVLHGDLEVWVNTLPTWEA